MELDDILLGFEKMPLSCLLEENERQDWKALYLIYLIKYYSIFWRRIVVEDGEIVHDKESNQ